MKLPPATARLLVGALCLCACTVQVFVGDELLPMSDGADGSGTSTSGDTSAGGSSGDSTAAPTATTGDDLTTSSETTSSDDAPNFVPPPQCQLPAEACDADGDDLALALGLGCGSFLPIGALEFAGPPESRAVTTGLGAGPTFMPRLGAHAVLLSTGSAAEVPLTIDAVMETSQCSQIGLPCPSTDFDDMFDLAVLPAPIDPQPVVCPEGQVPPPGDCSGTVDAQWFGDPRLAHDYSELRFSAEVPGNTLSLSLSLAFLTAEYPKRFPGGYNDLLIVWLESERWTGNIAVHPEQGVPVAAEVLAYAYTGGDAALADFAFAEHAATDWFTITAPVLEGETITVVIALFDESDGAADSAVLLDDLRWECNPVNLGGVDRP